MSNNKTLTGMLKKLGYSEDVELAKRIFKDWLESVGLPDTYGINRDGECFNTTESIRKLLMTLVDEPQDRTEKSCYLVINKKDTRCFHHGDVIINRPECRKCEPERK